MRSDECGVRRQRAARGGAPGGAAPLARVRAPSHGARAARSQGLPKGASQAPGASRRSIPPLGGGEEGKQAHPGPSTTGAAERWLPELFENGIGMRRASGDLTSLASRSGERVAHAVLGSKCHQTQQCFDFSFDFHLASRVCWVPFSAPQRISN